jgi:hypothetical protein
MCPPRKQSRQTVWLCGRSDMSQLHDSHSLRRRFGKTMAGLAAPVPPPRKQSRQTVWLCGRSDMSQLHDSHSLVGTDTRPALPFLRADCIRFSDESSSDESSDVSRSAIRLSDVFMSSVILILTTVTPARRQEWFPSACCIRSGFSQSLHARHIGTMQRPRFFIQICPPCSAGRSQSTNEQRPFRSPVSSSQNLIHDPRVSLSELLPSMFHAGQSPASRSGRGSRSGGSSSVPPPSYSWPCGRPHGHLSSIPSNRCVRVVRVGSTR